MQFSRNNIGYFIAFIILGAILGLTIGSFVAKLFPSADILVKPLTGKLGVNLEFIGFYIRLNISSIFGIILGIILFKWI